MMALISMGSQLRVRSAWYDNHNIGKTYQENWKMVVVEFIVLYLHWNYSDLYPMLSIRKILVFVFSSISKVTQSVCLVPAYLSCLKAFNVISVGFI